MLEVWINGERTAVAAGETVGASLARADYELRYVAVVVNETVIPAEMLDVHALRAGDRIEVLRPFSGG